MRRRREPEPISTMSDQELQEFYLTRSATEHRKLAVALLVDSENAAFAPHAAAMAAQAQVHALLALSAPS